MCRMRGSRRGSAAGSPLPLAPGHPPRGRFAPSPPLRFAKGGLLSTLPLSGPRFRGNDVGGRSGNGVRGRGMAAVVRRFSGGGGGVRGGRRFWSLSEGIGRRFRFGLAAVRGFPPWRHPCETPLNLPLERGSRLLVLREGAGGPAKPLGKTKNRDFGKKPKPWKHKEKPERARLNASVKTTPSKTPTTQQQHPRPHSCLTPAKHEACTPGKASTQCRPPTTPRFSNASTHTPATSAAARR